MGDFFLNGYKEEYPNCKFPTFNSGKTIERPVGPSWIIFFLMGYGGPYLANFISC
jgi:hypothetical protein